MSQPEKTESKGSRTPRLRKVEGWEETQHMKRFPGVLALFMVAAIGGAQSRSADVPGLTALKFLEGKWVGEGSSEVGHGGGYASFEEDLQGKALVRRNHAEYPATQDRPVYKHDDLMIIYLDPDSKGLRAFYTDSEGHVIHYTVSVAADGNTVTFLGEKAPDAPQYRLTYTRLGEDKMTILLEMSQPNEAGRFQKIVEGRMQKTVATH